jgi:hypothetical protein
VHLLVNVSKKVSVKMKPGSKELYKAISSDQAAQTRWISYTIMGLLGLGIILLLSAIGGINDIKSQKNNGFVIQPDGTTEKIKRIDSSDRTNEQLNRFAFNWAKTCLTANGSFDGKPDLGVKFQGRKIPTILYNCSFAIEPTQQAPYLTDFYDTYADHPLLKQTISLSAFLYTGASLQREVQVYVTTLPICSQGEKRDACIAHISKGLYTVPIAVRRVFLANGQPYASPEIFNLRFTVRAVSPYELAWTADQTPVGKMIQSWQKQGLRIEKIERLPDVL